jgi:hypothetical protein
MADATTVSERAGLAFASINALLKSFEMSNLDISEAQIDNATVEMFSHHKEHLRIHKVQQTHVDPYKIVCWFGCALLKTMTVIKPEHVDNRCQFKAVGYALIRTLGNFLNIDSGGAVILPAKSRQLLLQMLMEEQQKNHRHGIWQNGLYAAFHCSLATLRSVTDADIRLSSI